ncbi:C-factor [invertebrate metagenome]|uniref:C-factor n=1 Tax=invertebrate metagenome TaxID=1711999 RepID=A0A2H9T692_9ZZZZ
MMRKKALIFGTNGGIGQTLVKKMGADYDVFSITRYCPVSDKQNILSDYSEASLKAISDSLNQQGVSFSRIINATGLLHDGDIWPEKRLDDLSRRALIQYFEVNSVIPALLLQYFSPLLDRHDSSVFALLSAKVGSISDNRLGGWYGYRMSKAALNMLVKTASIELKRTQKQQTVVAIHPGTTESVLSEPFSKRIKPEKLYSPEQTANRLIKVMDNVSPDQTGLFLNWDSSVIPW